jgi:hypothetical protein
MNENNDLREKIEQAKGGLPLPQLMKRLGLAAHAKKNARCLWHDDQHPSFSVFKGRDGFWHYKCFVCDPQGGDEIAFLVKHFGISSREAIKRYLEMVGFSPSRPPKSHECRKSLGSPECLVSPKYHKSLVYPMSNGQGLNGETEKVLKTLAAHNACTERNTARKRRFKLVRDLKAIETGIGRELEIADLMVAFNEWHRLSQPFLDPAKTRDDYLAAFLAELGKVRLPTGEGNTLKKALETVSKLLVSELPVIPGWPDAPESWRKIAALHRELSRLAGGKTYFLSCRDTAKASPGLSYQQACDINRALERLGVIKIVRAGDSRPGGKASQFRYLLSQTEDRAPQAEEGRHACKEGEGQDANDEPW